MKNEKHLASPGLFILAIVLLLAFAGTAVAETPTEATTETPSTATTDNSGEGTVPVNVAGMKVFIDAETGRLRQPTEAEAAELASAMRQMFATKSHGPEIHHHEDGTMSAIPGMDYLNFLVARKNADGTLAVDCTDGVESAIDFVTAAVAPKNDTATEEK